MAFTKTTCMSILRSGAADSASASGRCATPPISSRCRASGLRKRRRASLDAEIVPRMPHNRRPMSNDPIAVPAAAASRAPWGLLGTIAWGATRRLRVVRRAVRRHHRLHRLAQRSGARQCRHGEDGERRISAGVRHNYRSAGLDRRCRCWRRDGAAGVRATIWRSFRRAAARSWSALPASRRC